MASTISLSIHGITEIRARAIHGSQGISLILLEGTNHHGYGQEIHIFSEANAVKFARLAAAINAIFGEPELCAETTEPATMKELFGDEVAEQAGAA